MRAALSHRLNDDSPELRLMAEVIVNEYADWGYPFPEGIMSFEMP